MSFDPVMAETRFGCGLSPKVPRPQAVDAMIARLHGPDAAALEFPVAQFDTFRDTFETYTALNRERRRLDDAGGESAGVREEAKQLMQSMRRRNLEWAWQAMMRCTWTRDGFRERLAFFWFDHFAAYGKGRLYKLLGSTYVEEAIRPNLARKFEDLLIAAATHPFMLLFLDQRSSVGPNSAVAQKKGGTTGLNENLAREVLELHTLGVGGPYSQDDVRQLAELFTGLSWNYRKGFRYLESRSEPGAETVLGKRYGGADGSLEDIHAVLRDLARHPVTARHLSTKLARHFVADTPPEPLVAAMTSVYLDTNGDLAAVYGAMLSHDDAWRSDLGNVKRPVDFVASGFRALAIAPELGDSWRPRDFRRYLLAPLTLMGQPWERPPGPQGWPEEDSQWLSPQGLAARLQWALSAPAVLSDPLPDPRAFVTDALGGEVPSSVTFAARAAENRVEGIALVLMSPAFQRH